MEQRLHLKLSPNPRATLPMLPKVDHTGCRWEVLRSLLGQVWVTT